MIVKVYLTALGHCGEYREVDIGDVRWPRIDRPLVETLLEETFYCGQNEEQLQDKPSVSMGDVAELDGRYWLCLSLGWKELSYEEWLNYLGMSLIDRVKHNFRVFADNVPNVLL